MIFHISFRRTALIASFALTGAGQAHAFGAIPGAFPPQAASSTLAMPSASETSASPKFQVVPG